MHQPRPLGASSTWARRLLSAFVLWHLVSMGASLTKKTDLGAAVRQVTGPYEKALGIWQSWGMFGPNPPLGTSWLKVDGILAGGSEVSLPALVGEKEAQRIDWHYQREQKVERNMFDKSKESLRAGYAAWLCRTWQGPGELAGVRIRKERHMTPEPGQRGGQVEVRDILLSEHACEDAP